MSFPQLATTVVGSYPASPHVKNLFNYCKTGQDPYADSIREAVEAQISAGIDIISDGQTRNDMIKLYATKLGGIRMRQKPVIIGKIEHRGPITLEDQKLSKEIIGNRAMLKGIITGPFTMAMSCQDEHYGSIEKLAFGFAEALNAEARALSGIVDILQIDEPFFSVECPDYASNLIGTIFAGVDIPRALHVCGDVSSIFQKLVELDVNILDHEFAAHPGLLDIVADVDFSQTIGFGCVRSDIDVAEGVPEVLETIKRGIDSIGKHKMMLDPDCGLRHLTPGVAREKLQNMVKARDTHES